MKGRKPKYPSELVAELAARVAAGESPSALAKEKNMARSSVRRCAESVRLSTEVKDENFEIATQVGTARQRERLFWRFIESYLRQGIALAPNSAPRDVAAMLEAAVKLRSLLPMARGGSKLPEHEKTSETLLIFQRSLSRTAEEPARVVDAEAVQEDLVEADRASSETATEEDKQADPRRSSEGKNAPR